MNVISGQDFLLKKNVQQTRPDGTSDLVVMPNASIFKPDQYLTYQSFVSLHLPFNPINTTGTYSKTQAMKYDAAGLGDVIPQVWMLVRAPALTAGASGVEGYYVDHAGFAMFPAIEIKAGSLRVFYTTDLINKMDYERSHPDAKLRNDPYVHRFENKSLLIQGSKYNPTFHVPIMTPYTKLGEYKNAWFQYLFARQSVEWVFTGRSVLEWTVNASAGAASGSGYGYALSTAPYLYGTSTALTESAITVELWGTFYLLDEDERAGIAAIAYFRQFRTVEPTLYPSTEAASVSITKEVTANHCTRAFMFAFQPTSHIDGTTQIAYGVGLKNYYVFHQTTVDEPFYSIQWVQNGLKLLDESNPISFLRHERWIESFGEVSKQPWILLANQPGLNSDVLIHTVNQSRIDKLQFVLKKNSAVAGTIFMLQDLINGIQANAGLGGVPFQ